MCTYSDAVLRTYSRRGPVLKVPDYPPVVMNSVWGSCCGEIADSRTQQRARVLDMEARVARSVEIAQTHVVPGFERALM